MKKIAMDHLETGKGKPVLIKTGIPNNNSTAKRLQEYAERVKKCEKGGDK